MCSLPLKLAIDGPSELPTRGTLAWLDHWFNVVPPKGPVYILKATGRLRLTPAEAAATSGYPLLS